MASFFYVVRWVFGIFEALKAGALLEVHWHIRNLFNMETTTIKDVLGGNASLKVEHEFTVSKVVIIIAAIYAFIKLAGLLTGAKT